MAKVAELFDLNKAVEQYSEKKAYTEGVLYYHKLIKGNKAIRHSDFYPAIKKFDAALKDFIKTDSTTALVDLTNIIPEYFVEGEVPDIFETEGLKVALDNLSEYLMHLRKLCNLDFYK
ncbi:MAG: hypothetical protein J5517_06470 [Eubacterium sp.]|nr:hypothetical protein [Eubacterium sp.]